MENKWKVITYTDFYYKIIHEVACESMAREYVERILERGDFFMDDTGIMTFIPTARIHKIKIIPAEHTGPEQGKTYLAKTEYGGGNGTEK